MPDVGTDHGVRADRRALADLRARVDDRGRIDLGPIGNHAEQQLALGDDLIADERRGLRPRQRGAAPAERISSRSRSPGTTCRRNFASLTPRRYTRAFGRRVVRAAAAGSPPPATAIRASARPASAARRENAPGKTLR